MASSTRKKQHGKLFLLALACGAALVGGNAQAQQSLANMLEPTRFALVIGNAAYGEYGRLNTLGSPCAEDPTADSDTKVVGDALKSAGWEVDVVCNLTTEQLRKKIGQFNSKVNLEPRAFGIIYFSGHGAEVAGTNYLFGVDADVNEKNEFKIYKQNPYARLFDASAVSLNELMQQVRPLWGKAVAMFIDACRTNPLFDSLRKEGLDLVRYPSKSEDVDNILYAFSTIAGEPSPDGGLDGISHFARSIAKVIRTQSATQQDELDLLVSAIGKVVIKDSDRHQVTSRSGIILRPPRYCLQGCPSIEEEWKSLSEEFITKTSHVPGKKPFPVNAMLSSGDARAVGYPAARRWRVSANETIISPVVALSDINDSPAAQVPPQAQTTAPPLRKVRFDVLYCSGDAATELRRIKSEDIRQQLSRFTGMNSPVGGFEVGEVRVVAVPPAVNQSSYKANDTALTYNRDSPAQQLWAEKLQSGLTQRLRLEQRPGRASDYMTVLVCDGAAVAGPGLTVYMQVATKEQLEKASALGAELSHLLPNARIARNIEVVAKSPQQTEVRYFSPKEATDATEVAAKMQGLLNQAVQARFVPGYEARLDGTRLLEIGIGTRDNR